MHTSNHSDQLMITGFADAPPTISCVAKANPVVMSVHILRHTPEKPSCSKENVETTMRPYYLLLLALTLLFVCSNEAVAVETQSVTSVFNVGLTQRLLRAEGTLADEERALGVGRLTTWFRFWRLRRVADKMKTTDVISAKESKWIDGWVKRDLSPDYVFKRLGLAKRGAKAMESQNYRLFESFTERMFAKDQALYTKWLSAKMTPEDVFKTLKLDKMKPAKAAKTEDFRRYEVYLYKWYDGK